MKVLALETSTRVGSAAILEDEKLLYEIVHGGKESHSRKILPSVRMILEAAGVALEEIDGFAVGIGPGSFTGLRIGLGAVKGLAFSFGRPLIGVSSLEALAMNLRGSPYILCPMLDARKGEVYAALYRFGRNGHLVRLAKEAVLAPERLLKGMKSEKIVFLGDGALLYRELIMQTMKNRAIFVQDLLSYPSAASVGLLALGRFKEGRFDDINALEPRYLRVSDAETKWRRAEWKKKR